MNDNHHNESPNDPGAPMIVAVSGGISAYKTAEVVSRLKKTGAAVHVLMTEAATRFVTPLTFEALSGNRVSVSVFPGEVDHPEQAYPHLYPATRAGVFVVAPATADVIARLAQGLGNDAVTTAALSLPATCRRYFAPAMNVEMWHQPVVQENVRRLEQLGWQRIGPESGDLACGMVGEGRMTEPADIVNTILGTPETKPLAGRKVMILSGPTCEPLDPIRFISNASSGKMGKALAEQAAALGAQVMFITGPVAEVHVPRGPAVQIKKITTADELLAAGREGYAGSDVIIYAAAVADYRPIRYHPEKMPKQEGGQTLELEATPDVAATLNKDKKPDQVAIGFALQTHDGEKRALEKMNAKHFDGIVLNAPDALGADAGTYRFFDADGKDESWGGLAKRECATRILMFAARKLPA